MTVTRCLREAEGQWGDLGGRREGAREKGARRAGHVDGISEQWEERPKRLGVVRGADKCTAKELGYRKHGNVTGNGPRSGTRY